MKRLIVLGLLGFAEAYRLKLDDEVDDLLAKQDEKDAREVADKEFMDANSKMNQISNISKQHTNAEDDDFMQ